MIIAFSGRRGTGKSVAAQYLVMNYGFKVISFAAKLKEIANILFPFEPKDLYGINKEKPFLEYDWSPRDFMIKFGNFLRFWDENYWVNIALKGIKGNIVIDDLRFKNEAKILKEKEAKLIRLERYAKYNPYKGDIDDPSEKDLDSYKDWDFTINSVENIDIKALHLKLDLIMSELEIEKK